MNFKIRNMEEIKKYFKKKLSKLQPIMYDLEVIFLMYPATQ